MLFNIIAFHLDNSYEWFSFSIPDLFKGLPSLAATAVLYELDSFYIAKC